MATSLEESKKRSRSVIFKQIPIIWCKDRENRSSGSWDSSSAVKKKKKREITEGKIYSPVGKFAGQAKKWLLLHVTQPTASKHWRESVTAEATDTSHQCDVAGQSANLWQLSLFEQQNSSTWERFVKFIDTLKYSQLSVQIYSTS